MDRVPSWSFPISSFFVLLLSPLFFLFPFWSQGSYVKLQSFANWESWVNAFCSNMETVANTDEGKGQRGPMPRANRVSAHTHAVQSCRGLRGMSVTVLGSHCCCNKSLQTQWLKTSPTYYPLTGKRANTGLTQLMRQHLQLRLPFRRLWGSCFLVLFFSAFTGCLCSLFIILFSSINPAAAGGALIGLLFLFCFLGFHVPCLVPIHYTGST